MSRNSKPFKSHLGERDDTGCSRGSGAGKLVVLAVGVDKTSRSVDWRLSHAQYSWDDVPHTGTITWVQRDAL